MPNTGIASAGLLEGAAVALHLLAHVAQRILRPAAVELVDRDEIGKVEHVDFLELAGGAELRRHHVQREVHMRDDGRVPLADAGSLDQYQVEAGALAGGNHLRQAVGNLAAGIAGG